MPPKAKTEEQTEQSVEATAMPPIDVGGEEPTTKSIFTRLIAAQSEIGNVAKNAENSFFKNAKGKASKFVDLAALNDAVIPVLNRHGLFLTQRLVVSESQAVLVTQIFSVDGEELLPSFYPIIAKDDTDPQKFGAGVTYARRYALMAYLGIAAEDDDGNTAAQPRAKTISPELQALIENLKAAGHTKETIPLELDNRFGKGVYKSITALKADEIKAWNEELTKEKVPF